MILNLKKRLGLGIRLPFSLSGDVLNDGGWAPANLKNLLIEEWDAEDRSSLRLDTNSGVSEWRGRKTGFVVAQETPSLRPTWAVNSFGGFPGISGNGAQHLEAATQSFFTGAKTGEIWAVVQQDVAGSDATQRNIVDVGGTIGVTRRLARAQVAGVSRARATAGDGTSGTSTTEGTVAFTGRQYIRGIFTATSVAVEIAGVQSAPAAVVPNTAGGVMRFFANANASPTNFWAGQIAYICFTELLTGESEARMREYCS